MVTIAIPFFNDEKYLEYAIKSVINQTYKDWTLLLVNDGSTDSSLKIAKKYEKKDPRIKVFSDNENKGLPYRLNQIAKLSKTLYLARMDSDDIMHPERIEKQLQILKENPYIDILGTNAYSIDDKNNIRGIRNKITDVNLLEKTTAFIHPTIIGKTEWFLNNPYSSKANRMEDTELWLRTYKKSNFYVTQMPLLFYREYGNSYYLKYFKSIKARFYIFHKNKNIKNLMGILSNIVKATTYYFFHKIGKEDYLIRRRFIDIDEKDKNIAISILEKSVK